MTLLTVSGLSHRYLRAGRCHEVLNDVSLTLRAGETTALLGRSGCGKSTLARLLVGLEMPLAGRISWRGEAISTLSRTKRQAFRRDVQLVFQDARSAVNPRKTVRDILREPMRHLLKLSSAEQEARVHEMMRDVGLDEQLLEKLPAQLSGGQLQRVCLARALAVRPALLILDEAVSSLDLMLQDGMIRLLQNLQRQSGMACLFITHDLRLAERFCQRVVVMEAGRIAETRPIAGTLQFSSAAGRMLQHAVLPAFPAPRRSKE